MERNGDVGMPLDDAIEVVLHGEGEEAADQREVLLTSNGMSLLEAAVVDAEPESKLERRRRAAQALIEKQISEEEMKARRGKDAAESSSFPLLTLIFDHLEPFTLHVGFSIAFSGVCRVVEMLYPLLLATVVDTMRDRPPVWLTRIVGEEIPVAPTVVLLTLLCVGLTVLQSLLQWLYSIVYTTLGEGVKHSVRMELYDKLLQREVGFIEERPQTRRQMLQLLQADCEEVEELLVEGPKEIVQMLASVAFGGLMMLLLNWQLAIVALSPLPFVILLSVLYWQKVAELDASAKPHSDALESRLANTLNHGMVFMKVFEAEITEYNRVAASSRAHKAIQERSKVMRGGFDPLIRLLILVGVAGVFAMGGFWVLDESDRGLTVGSLLYFILVTPMILWPVSCIGKLMQMHRKSIGSVGRMLWFMKAKSLLAEPTDSLELPYPLDEPTVEFEQVSFAYPSYNADTFDCDDETENAGVLSSITFSVPENSSAAIVGTRGSGKRTIVKLLLRLYDTSDGQVTIGGVPVTEMTFSDLYKNVALITHDPLIFEGTLAENINYGCLRSLLSPGVMEEVTEAAERACMASMLRLLPLGLNTMLTNGGPELSAGEKQLLGIARALRRNAPVLILHEATSGIDRETERLLLENFAKITEGKTTIITTDKLSLARQADKIIVLDGGEIVEEGTHDYLLARGVLYPGLWDVTTGHCGSSSKHEPEYDSGDIRNMLPRTPDPLARPVRASSSLTFSPDSFQSSFLDSSIMDVSYDGSGW